MFTDAHIHLSNLAEFSGSDPASFLVPGSLVCASACSSEEFLAQEAMARRMDGHIILSFGIHPQEPDENLGVFLDSLARDRRIKAVGESGFDLFDEKNRQTLEAQKKAWALQLSIAGEYRLPLIIHSRKALYLLFADTLSLARLPAVIFHGWPGSLREAESFLARGVNAYFSAGKGLLRGDRSLVETVCGIQAARLLSETDAPWMRSRGEPYSVPKDIVSVVTEIARLRGTGTDETQGMLERNFRAAFSLQ